MRRLAGPVLQISQLSRSYGARPALASVDLSLADGEIRGILGPRCAGKTTLLRILAGLAEPTEGDVWVLGHKATARELRGRVALVGADDATTCGRVSGFASLVLAGRVHGLSAAAAAARAETIMDELLLASVAERPIGGWSPDEHRRLAFARALMSAPELLLIDEATTPTSDATDHLLRTVVTERARRGCAVLWTTRRLSELTGLARDVILLANGRVRYAGSVEALALRALAGSAEDVAARVPRAA
jgi:ABC-2 type transport system ATP-binding protein